MLKVPVVARNHNTGGKFDRCEKKGKKIANVKTDSYFFVKTELNIYLESTECALTFDITDFETSVI